MVRCEECPISHARKLGKPVSVRFGNDPKLDVYGCGPSSAECCCLIVGDGTGKEFPGPGSRRIVGTVQTGTTGKVVR